MKDSDAAVREAVLRELRWDTRIDATHLQVEVNSGVVTLTGNVTNWAMRLACQEAAHRVRDVLDVVNNLDVRIRLGGGRTDTDIAHSVRQALEWDVMVPDDRIRSTVSEGWVTLDGEVEYFSQREDAEAAIRNLIGVRGVSNNLAVKPVKVLPEDVRASIEGALERQAEREAKHLTLNIEDGRVVLSGVVRSWHEKQAVLGAVKGTPGVRAVEDRLRLEPYSR